MTSQNFHYLNEKLPELEALGGFAEQYVHPDPASCGVKLRLFGETVTNILYKHLNICLPDEQTFIGLLNNEDFRQNLPKTILSKLHLLRKVGNKAAHGKAVVSDDAVLLLKEAYDLAAWLYASMFNGSIDDIPSFVIPKKSVEKRELYTELVKKEEQIAGLLDELKQERDKASQRRKSEQELGLLVKNGENIANILQFDEETTRRLLIDEQLAMAGWDVGPKGISTEQVGQEVELSNLQSDSGIGFADYVLWGDNGKPLAVIEAKRTSKDAEIGKKQAAIYADGLEKKHGQRPVIFFTNGYDIFIWNNLLNEPPRKIFGFYAKDNLEYFHFQKTQRLPLNTQKIDTGIVDRNYQIEAIKRVHELFETKHRKGLIVQATGTGKTRVAIALAKSLMDAGWVKRILFLCDRRELRKQAKNVFNDFISETPTIVNSKTAKERDKRIYLGTYPAMLKIYQTFDVGFFDLIIADESHRSIYNVYGELFKYFDCYQIGLTATPVEFVNRNTFRLFECRGQDPTANYSFDDAINDTPRWLNPFEVHTVTTKFLREGIRFADMTPEQQQQVEEQEEDPESIDYGSNQVDKQIFNKPTNRIILRNLMDNGLKLEDGSLGKSIIFARNHRHAILLLELFDELYPQQAGLLCDVIDNYNPKAEQLIDDFKGKGTNDRLTIVISVDMMDTGVDVPEILNLVFAKPVRSYAKFWQMIGRGTRLCKNLLGENKDKKKFRIFDHWQNFEWFDLNYKPVTTSAKKSLLQRLFESRIELAGQALQKFEKEIFDQVIELIYEDISALATVDAVDIKEKWREINIARNKDLLLQFDASTIAMLKNEIAPLMMWRDSYGFVPAYDFDFLISKLQTTHLLESADFNNFKDDVLNKINLLPKNLNPIQAKAHILKQLNQPKFWDNITYDKLEEVRLEIRGIMKYIQKPNLSDLSRVVDIEEEYNSIERGEYIPQNRALDMAAYRERVTQILTDLFESSITLQKIKNGQAVSESEIEELVSLVLIQDPGIDLNILQTLFPETTGHLELAIRRIIGLEPGYVEEQVNQFIKKHPGLTAKQIKFLDLLKNHITRYGAIKLERLYENPFTALDSDGIDGVFGKEKDDLVEIIKRF